MVFPMTTIKSQVSTLEIYLGDIFVGHLSSTQNTKNIFVFDESYIKLAPAYDIVSTLEYLPNQELALNFAKTKLFYAIDKTVLLKFANRIEVDESFVRNIANEIVESAHAHWPALFKELPIKSETREALKDHWKKLKNPFQMKSLSGFL